VADHLLVSVSFQHLVLTRFSVKTSWSWAEFPMEWLQARLELFEAYCLPSLATQSASEFRWLVYCDESTHPDVLARLRAYREECPQLEVTMTGTGRHPIGMLESLVDPAADVVLTTRIDSDDAMHLDLVAAVQEYLDPFAASDHEQLLINFPRGYKVDVAAARAYYSHLDNSPFHSLAERRGRPIRTVMSGNHSILHQQYPTHQDHSIPAWLQVVYGGNIRNNITTREIPTDAAVLPELFGIRPAFGSAAPSAVRPPEPGA
jgi:hypothetical protein